MKLNVLEIAMNVYVLLLALALLVFGLVGPLLAIDEGHPALVVVSTLLGVAGAYLLLLQVRTFRKVIAR